MGKCYASYEMNPNATRHKFKISNFLVNQAFSVDSTFRHLGLVLLVQYNGSICWENATKISQHCMRRAKSHEIPSSINSTNEIRLKCTKLNETTIIFRDNNTKPCRVCRIKLLFNTLASNQIRRRSVRFSNSG